MKIIAESRPADSLPYLHLGYIAARFSEPHGGVLLAGALLVVTAIPLIFRNEKAKNRRGRTVTVARFRRSMVGFAGTAVLLAGLVAIKMAMAIGHERGRSFYGTLRNMRAVITYLGNDVSGSSRVPSVTGEYDVATLQIPEGAQGISLSDGWGRPLRLRVSEDAGYQLVSAGADGAWNTPDDYAHSFAMPSQPSPGRKD